MEQTMIIGDISKYLKVEKFTLYKIAKEGKISAVKIEFGNDDEVIIHIPYGQESIKKIKIIYRRKWNLRKKYWKIPYGNSLTSKLQILESKNLIIAPCFYLNLLQKEIFIKEY